MRELSSLEKIFRPGKAREIERERRLRLIFSDILQNVEVYRGHRLNEIVGLENVDPSWVVGRMLPPELGIDGRLMGLAFPVEPGSTYSRGDMKARDGMYIVRTKCGGPVGAFLMHNGGKLIITPLILGDLMKSKSLLLTEADNAEARRDIALAKMKRNAALLAPRCGRI